MAETGRKTVPNESRDGPELPRAIAAGADAVAAASAAQRIAYERLRRRCSIRGALLLSNGQLQVGFESSSGRDREAFIAPDGTRVKTRDTWIHTRGTR